MALLGIRRGGGWGDRFRAYVIWIDGERRGEVRANECVSFELPAGQHVVELRIDTYGSGAVPVVLGEDGLALECGPNRNPLLATVALVWSRPWIFLREVARG